MGILRDIGRTLGEMTGIIIAAPLYLAGELVDSDFIKDVAETACKVTAHTGDFIGDVAEGTGKCVAGVINRDGKAAGEGLGQIVDAGMSTVISMGKGVLTVAEQGCTTVSAIAKGDSETAIKAGKELAKVALVSTIAIGIADVIDGVMDINDLEEYEVVENEDMHYVSPHVRRLSDGREIWVDGDGNTSVHRDTGWMQTNPDYRVKR